MAGRLAGRNALITGAADGIGKGLARRFASEGASVIVADFDAALGTATADAILAEGGAARFVAVDVTDKQQVLAMMDAAGPVDILVNNAWRGQGVARIENKTDEQFETSLQMGLFAAQWTMQAALPHMRRSIGAASSTWRRSTASTRIWAAPTITPQRKRCVR